jgi:hypothetical protein
MEGEVKDDADFARLRAQFETYVLREMREAGFIPVLDLGSYWSTSFDPIKEKYSFVLSMHGFHVGRRKACQVEGITAEGKMIPRNTPPSKSKQSSLTSG